MRHYTEALIEGLLTEAPALSYPEQERKMDGWHNGTRGQNMHMSDDKLEMNYDICKKKGYSKEAAILKAEGQARGLPWAQQPQQQTAQPQQQKGNMSITPTIADFNDADARYVYDHSYKPQDLITAALKMPHNSSAEQTRHLLAFLIIAQVLGLSKAGAEIKKFLRSGRPDSILIDAIKEIISDGAIKARLEEMARNIRQGNKAPSMSIAASDIDADIVQRIKDAGAYYKEFIDGAMARPGTIRQIVTAILICQSIKSLTFGLIEACVNFLVANAGMDLSEISTIINNAFNDSSVMNKLSQVKAALNEGISEAIEKHDELNQKLWDGNRALKPEVKEKIMQIVDDFCEGLADNEIRFKLTDVKLVGSNCSYNYNKDSDLDVHLVFDLGIYDDAEKQDMAEAIYGYARGAWNRNHTVEFYGIPVEIFVETSGTEQLN